MTTESADYRRIARAIGFIRSRAAGQPSLSEVAAEIGLSAFHCQRLFRRWAGISPKRFLQVLTVEHAKDLLRESADVLSASLGAGLSGPGRLHDLFVALEAVTPGEFKARGAGLDIVYGVHGSPLGDCFVATTARGVVALSFLDRPADRAAALARLRNDWGLARIRPDPEGTADAVRRIFGRRGAAAPPILVRGTNFQVQVWRALLSVGPGSAVTYAGLARMSGHPNAFRAVGSAVGANPVAYLIPCHRVLRAGGELGEYRWGTARKAAALALDAGR
jgi:AraC family transcriptional regulator of adaptative response/methylated-DNA-[protein]-cysteine methyltransferase